MKKTILTIALTMVMCFAIVGTTFAWLVDSTAPIKNTFTVGNVDIELVETKGTKTDDENFSFKMVPGNTIEKDPTVTVKANSEDCWLFVKIEKSNNVDSFLSFATADGWTPLDGESGVYYRKATSSTSNQSVPVLKDNKVTVLPTVTKDALDKIAKGEVMAPILTFTAYAVQMDGFDSTTNSDAQNAALAWVAANDAANYPADTTT